MATNESKDIFNAPAGGAKPENKQVAAPTATPGKAPAPANPPAPATAPAAPAPANVPVTTTQAAAPAVPAKLADLIKCFTSPRKAFLAAVGDTPENQQRFAREINFAIQDLMDNDYKAQCARQNPDYLIEAIKNVGLTDLTLNPELKLGYLVPRSGKLRFQSSYMGKREILMRAGVVKYIEAVPVFASDKFRAIKGLHEVLEHEPDWWGERTQNTLKGVYWKATLPNGMVMWDVVPMAKIIEVMKRSDGVKSSKSTPWQTDFIAMALKTAINRAFNQLPKSGLSEHQLAIIAADNQADNEDLREYIREREQNQPDTFEETGYEEVK